MSDSGAVDAAVAQAEVINSPPAAGGGPAAAAGAVAEVEEAAARGGVLRNKDFAKLWAGESVSLIGTQVTQFTMPLVAIITLNATVFEVGVLNALRFVPVIILSLFAGVWLDRRRRRPVLIGCALGNAVLISLVPITSVTGVLSIGLLYVVVTLAGALSMTFDIGALSYVPSLVDREQLAQGNSMIQASTAFAGVAGPGLAGILIGLVTAPITLSVDAVSYLFSAAGLISIRKQEPAPEVPAERTTVWRSMAEGLRTVYGNSLLRAMLTQGTMMNLAFGIYITVFVVYAVRTLGLTPLKLGIVMAAVAVGSLTGAMLAGRVKQALGLGRTMTITVILVSAAPFLLLIPHDASAVAIAVLTFAHFSYGCNVTINNVHAITIRQVVTPPRLLGRMNASYRMVLFGSGPLGMIGGGLLGNALGLRTALVIAVIGMAVPVVWIFFSPVFRLKEMPEGPPAGTTERT